MKRSLAVLAGAASIAILAAGCSPLSQVISMQAQHVATCGPSHGVVLIAGAHRDAPAPSLGPRVACRVAAAIKGGKPVLLAEASGQPRLVRVRNRSVRITLRSQAAWCGHHQPAAVMTRQRPAAS
jgi:hypothetical protein